MVKLITRIVSMLLWIACVKAVIVGVILSLASAWVGIPVLLLAWLLGAAAAKVWSL